MLQPMIRMPAAGLASRIRGSDLLVPAFLLLHAAGLALFPPAAKQWSYAFMIAAPLLAAAACLYRARRSGVAEGWRECALAAALWAGGMSAGMYSDLFTEGVGDVPGLGMLLYVLYGVPLIFALASPKGELKQARLVDGTLALALGILFFVHTFTFASLAGTDEHGFLKLRLMFDVENGFVAVFALIRFIASRDGSRRAFFGSLTLFAAVYLTTAIYINHFQSETEFGAASDLLIGVPFLLLAVLALRRGAPRTGGEPGWRRPSPELARVVRAGSPLMLPVTLLAVSGLLVIHHPWLAVAGFVAALLGYGLRNVLVQLHAYRERDSLAALSRTDQLTGLPNRRHFDETLQREWNRAHRARRGLCVLMIDIDHFKLLNDGLGHQTGDLRLQAVGSALKRCAGRTDDLVARYGGEEFIAVLPSTGHEEAARVAEKMRAAVADLHLATPAPAGVVTISVGLGWAGQVDSETPNELVAAADAALYDAKRDGRNCVRQRQAAAPMLLRVAG